MAVLDELIRSIELWLRLSKEQVPLVDPNLDPVLLVPGIAGSILNAVDDDGKEERVWVRILGADHEFQAKVWSHFDPSTGKALIFFPIPSRFYMMKSYSAFVWLFGRSMIF